MVDSLVKGFILGFSIAAPVGPIGILCIRRTLSNGLASGFVSGLGATTADGFYGLCAGLGLTIITAPILNHMLWTRTIGGMILLYIGVKTFRTAPPEQGITRESKNLAGDYASTLLLTLTNPLTILMFAAAFVGIGLAGNGGKLNTLAIVAGVVAGSAAWWLILSWTVNRLRARLDLSHLQWVNRIAGAVITVFGVIAIGSMLRG